MVKRLIILIEIVFLSGVFNESVHNPLTLPYFREAVTLFNLTFFLFILILNLSKGKVRNLDLNIILISIIPWLASAYLARVTLGQPLYYGLIEDRKVLEIIAAPVVIFLLRDKEVKLKKIEKLIYRGTILAILLNLLFQIHLIPDLRPIFSTGLDKTGSFNRDNRASICINILIAGFCYYSSVSNKKIKAYVLPILILATVFLSTETRSILLALVLIYFVMNTNFSLKSIVQNLIILPLFGILLIVVIISIVPLSYLTEMSNLILMLFQSNYLEDSARGNTINAIIESFGKNYFGYGALSLGWKGGFHTLFGEYFFLADVGTFGILFRYGIFAIPLILCTIIFLWLRIKKTVLLNKFTKSVFIYLIITSFLGGFQFYQGSLMAIPIIISGLNLISETEIPLSEEPYRFSNNKSQKFLNLSN